jgi:uncharacterized protein (TIGR03790 family)
MLLTGTVFLALTSVLCAAGLGDEVIVVYNSRVPGSKDVADYYAARRGVPRGQIFGFALRTNEIISRSEFEDELQKPLAKALESKKLWHIGSDIIRGTNGEPGKVIWKVQRSKIRYAVLCYGIPVRIDHDPELKEKIPDDLRPEFRRNGAAVDSELALLPRIEQHLPLTGPLLNSLYTVTNAGWFDPTNGILMVARLDGPSASIARGLVDKAIQAETNGLCGRAYFDSRGLPTNSPYHIGDEWMLAGAKICQDYAGFETVLDENPSTFPADFPMSQIAIYCGWYDESASGPFAQKTVEFMPGAFAYHLHSASAAIVRTSTERWVGPFLAKGAAATMGSVDEPYLSGTPDVGVFCARWILLGFSFGEAAYACQEALSWQTTVIGDPLYRPFAKPLLAQLAQQNREHSNSSQWSYLRLANLNLAQGKRPIEVSTFLESLPETQESAVLTEKLGDLYNALGKPASAIETYENALKLAPSPLQAVRIRLELADKLVAEDRKKEAYAQLKALLEADPDYPGKPTVLKRLEDLARQLGDKQAAAVMLKSASP